MALHTAEAQILDVVNLQEHDRIVSFLTREHGLKRGVARGARRKYSRFSGQLQPLAKVRVTWFQKPEKDLVRISSVETVRSSGKLQRHLEDILLGGYLAEHLTEFAQENEESDHLYRLLDATVEALVGGADRRLVARYFEVWVLQLSGIFPELGRCSQCGRALGEGGARVPASADALLCPGCGEGLGGLRLSAADLALLREIRRRPLAELARTPPPAERLTRLEGLAAAIRRAFLQRELRSYRVMERTLEEIGESPA
ncbi:MAG: DNA repair protein RecO [Thermoanaerobaculia bacterium]|nr:DNA repair protein RecO [Thermoanaerobaculia bacterium]